MNKRLLIINIYAFFLLILPNVLKAQIELAHKLATVPALGSFGNKTSNLEKKLLAQPIANFSTQGSACSSSLLFQDSSLNAPLTWEWDFGDSITSTLENPSHTYQISGTYHVKLKVCNSNGCDSISKAINFTSTIYSCIPQTKTTCCGYGITNFQLNTINNSSLDATEGYQNFGCITTNLVIGQSYMVSVTTQPSSGETIYLAIDYNRDGQFSPSEMSIIATNSIGGISSKPLTIPFSAIPGLLPLRIVDYINTTPQVSLCSSIENGQCEDYYINVSNGLPSAINQNSYDPNFVSVFPNPFHQESQFDYQLTESNKISISITDILGSTIQTLELDKKQQAGKYHYSFKLLNAGTYFLKFQAGNKTSIYRIVNTQ